MLFGMTVALIATAILDAQDGNIDTDVKYYVANTLMGGLIGIGVGLAWEGILVLATGGFGIGAGPFICGGAMAVSSARIGSISVAGAWASAEIITGVGVLSGLIYLAGLTLEE